ncbi:MAG: hypothetical protein IID18_07165 [Nitrospinae bacterium]|nr:hypothetical protein [Nitrospinota bacterium]
MEDESKNKHDFLIHLLGEGDVMVCLDARRPEVDIPATHKNESALNLVFSLNFKRPIDVCEDGIYATLAFGGRPHKCVIPFEAVWAIYDPETQKGQVWEGSFPKDLKLKVGAVDLVPSEPSVVEKTSLGSARSRKSGRSKKNRSHLRVIK